MRSLRSLIAPYISRFNCQTANAPPPVLAGLRVPPCPFPLPKKRGEQSADRRWCGTPHPVARLAVEPISGSPEITGGIRPPARLSALCRGVLLTASGRAFCSAFRAAVSQLLAGGHSTSGRSPDAARE